MAYAHHLIQLIITGGDNQKIDGGKKPRESNQPSTYQ